MIRIVKMTFLSENRGDFLALFNEVYPLIGSFPGCRHLELWNDQEEPDIFFTYSIWDSEAHLSAYRKSELFRNTWTLTKAMFAEKAETWSLDRITDGLDMSA